MPAYFPSQRHDIPRLFNAIDSKVSLKPAEFCDYLAKLRLNTGPMGAIYRPTMGFAEISAKPPLSSC
jgi:hypothetical protein